jgi:Zn-dependent metalloprotease
MGKRRAPQRMSVSRLRVRAATLAVCAGAAISAAVIALVAMTALILLLGALGVSAAPSALGAAAQDALVALYVVQLVGVSFFNHTAELRFAAIPGLLLVGLAIASATAIAARRVPGPARRKMTLALTVPVPYALLLGCATLVVPLHLTAPGFGTDVPIAVSPVEAFLLPFAWAMVFASVGGLLGVFGRDWRHAVSRQLGVWTAPLGASARALTGGLAFSLAIAVITVVSLAGGNFGWIVGGDFARLLAVLGVAVVTLPTLAAAVFVSGFGVPFDWHVEALSEGHGSLSAFGGALPSSNPDPSQAHGGPAILMLAPAVVLLTLFAIGWLSARRSDGARLGFADAARAVVLTTSGVWILALLARMVAHAGGLLGFEMAPDPVALLWRVPLLVSAGCFTGCLAHVMVEGAGSRRRLAGAIRVAVTPSRWLPSATRRPAWVQHGLTSRAALSLAFLTVPAMALAMGATGTVTSAASNNVSLAPIAEKAEEQLEETSVGDESVAVTVNPTTHAVETASVDTPLTELGVAPGAAPAVKAKEVLDEYGELFGLSTPSELGHAQVTTDQLGMTHVSFTQIAAGVPVFAGGIGVHFSRDGKAVNFISGTPIPDVSVAHGQAKLSSDEAVEIAEQALPNGKLAQAPTLQVYAGLPPYTSGPNARLSWFVWLIDESGQESKEYVVDAVDGKILDTVPVGDSALYREVFDAKGKSELPGTLVRKEEQGPTADADVNNAYDNTGHVYEFYSQLERDSYNNAGAHLLSTVHVGEPSGGKLENAYWNGKQMVFGDNYTAALDVVGHELTHAVTENTSELVSEGESGALNEGFSDMMGAAIESSTVGEEDWEIGENLPGGAIRSLSEPGKYHEHEDAGISNPDPAKLSEWVQVCLDNFGIHINSTVPSHAFYLAAQSEYVGLELATLIFYRGFTVYLKKSPTASLEAARAAVLQAAYDWFLSKEDPGYKAIEKAFNDVGLNGVALPPPPKNCGFQCSFAQALKSQATGNVAVDLLATLYKARGELAAPSAAGDHFLPLYEEHMGRITELIDQDPALARMAVGGLEEIAPALEALREGEGRKYSLTKDQMARIEIALKRLARDDRLFGGDGAGELADLIEEELEWLGLPSYAGMNYQAGFTRLNTETETHTMLVTSGKLVDPNCLGTPYPNDFAINGLSVDTPGHRIPGQVSPLVASGVFCGTEVEVGTGKSGCPGENTLNTSVSVQLPPGTKVNSTKNLPAESWVGESVGRVIACAGEKTQAVYGQAGLLSLKTWEASQCPTTAIACYEGRTGFEGQVGRGYAYITESGGILTLTTSPVTVPAEGGFTAKAGFGQFNIKLCARAGEAASESCGGTTATWVHQNGEPAEAGCVGGKGLYTATGKNQAGQSTLPARDCVRWDSQARMQTIDAPNSLNAISCVPSSTTCVASNSKGNAFYSTNVSATSSATWTSWTGPGTSPSWALACPGTTLCVIADGEVTGGGGNVYKATSLGGAFSTSFLPTNGVGSISCPSTSFCVTAQEGGGFIRYSTNPSGVTWTARSIGTGAMKGVSCLSTSFCAVVDGTGNVRVATTEARVKEATGYAATNVDGTKALTGVACSSTTNCLAIDGGKEVLKLTIAQPAGTATVSKVAVPGAGELASVTCANATCVAVDAIGGIFTSTNSGAAWTNSYGAGDKLKSVSCATVWLCAAVNVAGDVVTFNPAPTAPNLSQTVSSGNVVNASSCVPNTTTCVVSDSKGKAYYATNVSTTANATWNLWNGPAEQSPSQAVACPSTAVCLLADGKSTEGGNLYYATSLGGAFSTAFLPASGVDALSCPSASFCLAAEKAFGRFRYSTTPASATWTLKELAAESEATAMKGASCLSSSFCAMVDNKGNVYVANTAEKVQSTSWVKTNVDGTTALSGIACMSTTLCVAVDSAGNSLRLAISAFAIATATKQNIGNVDELTGVACPTSTRCVAVDNLGVVFVSATAAEGWTERLDLPNAITSVACASTSICIATDKAGQVTAFDTR